MEHEATAKLLCKDQENPDSPVIPAEAGQKRVAR